MLDSFYTRTKNFQVLNIFSLIFSKTKFYLEFEIFEIR